MYVIDRDAYCNGKCEDCRLVFYCPFKYAEEIDTKEKKNEVISSTVPPQDI